MAVYMGADHLVWAGQAGVLQDKELAGNMQKVSLWAWFAASAAGLATQINQLTGALDDMTAAVDEDGKKTAAARVQKIMLDIVTNSAQGVLVGASPRPGPTVRAPCMRIPYARGVRHQRSSFCAMFFALWRQDGSDDICDDDAASDECESSVIPV